MATIRPYIILGVFAAVMLTCTAGCQTSEALSSAMPSRRSEANDAELARRAFDLVNNERLSRGLAALQYREDLSQVALRHTSDQIGMNKLSHRSSDGRLLENRLKAYDWVWAGENLARNKGFDDSAAEAVRGWVNSPRHYANMFRPDFRQAGMAVMRDSRTGYTYFTQVFITPAH